MPPADDGVTLDLAFDGHTHTPWCPHASRAPLGDYLDQAISLGLQRYGVTEHTPLPHGFRDPFGRRECAGAPEELEPYLDEAEKLREAYAGRLEVLVGLEIDYLGAAQGGWHGELLRMLHRVHSRLDPEATLLSVHFIGQVVVDGTPEMSAQLVPEGAPPDAYHLRYYACLRSAIEASWTWRGVDLRPRRIAHFTLPRKFRRVLPLAEPERVLDTSAQVLERIAAEGLTMEINTAGLDKPHCGETYLPEPLLSRAVALGVPLAFGSDAHDPAEVGRHRAEAAAAVVAAGGTVRGL